MSSVPPPRPSERARRPHLPRGVRVSRWLIDRLGSKTLYLILLACIVGVGGGLGAVAFRYLIAFVGALAFPMGSAVDALTESPWHLIVLSPTLGGAIVGPLIYFLAKEARGSGTPEVMDAVANHGGRIRARVAVVKTIASALSIGAGASVGREGPIVQIGSSFGSTLGQLLHLDARTIRLLVGCGAASGIAATFNAPLAGLLFSLEVILGFGTIRNFTPVVVASVLATVISRHFLGDHPAFEVPHYALVSAWELPLYVLLGLLAAVTGVVFGRGLFIVEDLWERVRVHDAARPALGGLLVGGIALLFPQVMEGGYDTMGHVLSRDSHLGILTLLGLMFAKIIATHICIGAGFSGGVFAPSLFIGAMLGAAFGTAANVWMPGDLVAPSGAYALVAMGAVVSASTHAPLTVILIVFEMTGDYHMILPLMLATLIASTLSVRLSRESIYSLKLARRGARVGTARDEVMRGTTVGTQMRDVERTVRPNAPWATVVALALEAGSRPLYVAKDDGQLLGTISLEDTAALIRDEAVLQDLLIAYDVMRPPVRTVGCDDTLDVCLKVLSHQGLPELPVVDTQSRLLGVVTRADILMLYDREVLQQRGGALGFMDADQALASSTVQLPTGERIRTVQVAGRLVGQTLRSLDLRARYGVHVHGFKAGPGEPAQRPEPEMKLTAGTLLLVTGQPDHVRDVQDLGGVSDSSN